MYVCMYVIGISALILYPPTKFSLLKAQFFYNQFQVIRISSWSCERFIIFRRICKIQEKLFIQ